MKYYDDDYDADEVYPTKDETVRRPEIQLESLRGLDWLIALILAGVTGGLLTIWAFPGLCPDAWEDVAIGAGLRPIKEIFPGFWNALVRGLYSLSGVATGTCLLKILGRIVAGVTVGLVYLLLRQILSITIRVRLQFSRRRFFVVRGVALLGALFFACSDPVWRAGQTFTPPLMLLFLTVLVLTLFFGFLMSGGMGQIYFSMFLLGLLSAETPMGFFLLALVWGVFLLALRHGAVAANSPILNPVVEQSSKWHLTFLYAFGLVIGVGINCTTFVLLFDGLTVFAKAGADVPLMYATHWWMQFIHAASGMGWVLGLGIGVLPFVVSAVLLPRAVDEEQFLPYHMGAVFFVTGAFAFAQLAELPPLWFWTWSNAATINSQYFLLVLMLFSAASVVFALAVMAVDICCRDHKRLAMQRFAELKDEADAVTVAEDSEDVKPLGTGARVVLVAVPVLLLAGVVPGRQQAQTRRMLAIINDYVKEVLAECGDVQWIFTNGPFNPILELEAAASSPTKDLPLRALSMMAGKTPREQYIRTHGKGSQPLRTNGNEIDGASQAVLLRGAPDALRVWSEFNPDRMSQVAFQLGFEVWKRRDQLIPPCSGLVSRLAMPEEERIRGVDATYGLAERILSVYANGGPAKSAGRNINMLFRMVQWHIARLSTMRAELADYHGQADLALRDKSLADELDNANASVKALHKELDRIEMQIASILTPQEGLKWALQNRNFAQIRVYAEMLLQGDSNDPYANFAMGMSYYEQKQWARSEEFLRKCLDVDKKKYLIRPKEYIVLNDLAEICRHLQRYDEGLEFAHKALKIAPDSPGVKKTIRQIREAREKAKAEDGTNKTEKSKNSAERPASSQQATKATPPVAPQSPVAGEPAAPAKKEPEAKPAAKKATEAKSAPKKTPDSKPAPKAKPKGKPAAKTKAEGKKPEDKKPPKAPQEAPAPADELDAQATTPVMLDGHMPSTSADSNSKTK